MNGSAALRSRRLLVVNDKLEIHDDFAKISPGAGGGRAPGGRSRLFGETRRPAGGVRPGLCRSREAGLELVRGSIADATLRPPSSTFACRPDGTASGPSASCGPSIRIEIVPAWPTPTTRGTASPPGSVWGPTSSLKKPFEVIEVRQIAHALTQKWCLLQEKKRHLDELELEVTRRTAELAEAMPGCRKRWPAAPASRRSAGMRRSSRHWDGWPPVSGTRSTTRSPSSPATWPSAARSRQAGAGFPGRVVRSDERCDRRRRQRRGADRRIVGEIKQFSRASEAALGPVDVRASVRAAHRLVDSMVRHRASSSRGSTRSRT